MTVDAKDSLLHLRWHEIKDGAPNFVAGIVNFASQLGLHINGLEVDHIGLRIANTQQVDILRANLDQSSLDHKPLSEATVNGRPILIYKLQQPLQTGDFQIPCIELPYPAQKHDYPDDGWEHLEVVLPGEGTIEEKFRKRFPNFTGTYELSSPKVDTEQLPNETIVIKNPKNKMQCIKFHGYPIEKIVTSKEVSN